MSWLPRGPAIDCVALRAKPTRTRRMGCTACVAGKHAAWYAVANAPTASTAVNRPHRTHAPASEPSRAERASVSCAAHVRLVGPVPSLLVLAKVTRARRSHGIAFRCIASASLWWLGGYSGCICAYYVRHCRFDFELWAKAPNGLEFEFLHRADTMLLNIGHMCSACGLSVATRTCTLRVQPTLTNRTRALLLRGFPLRPSRFAVSHLDPRALRPLFSLSLRRKQTNKTSVWL